MTGEQFLKRKGELLAEQHRLTDEINQRYSQLGAEFLKAHCPFEIGQVVDINGRDLKIQHIEPLTWFEVVMIRLYGVYLDNNQPETNGIALNENIKLSCQDKQTV